MCGWRLIENWVVVIVLFDFSLHPNPFETTRLFAFYLFSFLCVFFTEKSISGNFNKCIHCSQHTHIHTQKFRFCPLRINLNRKINQLLIDLEIVVLPSEHFYHRMRSTVVKIDIANSEFRCWTAPKEEICNQTNDDRN